MNNLEDDLNRAEPTTLTQSKVYIINGVLYRYLHKTDSTRNTKYIFRPLPRQNKKADLQLNSTKVYMIVFEVLSLYGQTDSECISDNTEVNQMKLF